LEKLPQTARVVAVGVGDPDPTDVGWIEYLCQRGHEILLSGAEAGVDDHGLLGVKHESVDGKEERGCSPESRNWGVIVEDRDITDPVNLHGARFLGSEGDPGGEQAQGVAAVWTAAAGDDAAKVGGIHNDLFTARAGAPAAAGRAGELQSVGLAMAAGPLGHNVCDQNAVVVGGEHRLSIRRASEVQPVHPRIASKDHIGEVTDGPFFRYAVDDLCPRQTYPAYEAGNSAASLGTTRAGPMQLGAQLFRAKVLPLPYLDRGQRIYARLPGLLPAVAARIWRATSNGVEKRLVIPTMWATRWRTSQAEQSVGRAQSSDWRASTASVTRWYSVLASRIAVGRSIIGWTTLVPGQAVVIIMRCSSRRGSDDATVEIALSAGFSRVSRGKAETIGPEIDRAVQ
jgi:hypothetical protein